jgi:hypothetical protein
MAGKVVVKFTGQPDELLRRQEAVIRKQAKMNAELRRSSRESKKTANSAKEMGDSFGSAGSLIRAALGTGGAIGILRLMQGEIDIVAARWKAAAEVIKGTAQQTFSLATALPEQVVKQGDQFLADTLSEAQTTGLISRVEAKKAATAAGSQLGAGNPQLFRDAVIQGSRLSGLTEGADAPLFSGAAVSVADIAQIDSAKAALGLVFKLGTGTPITDPTVQARNLPQALAKITGSDPSIETSSELLSVLAQFSKDPTGLQVGTTGRAGY